MKILVVDDHPLVREGLRQILKGLDEHVEVLEAPHCGRAFALATLHPDLDLVLLDYHLPDMNGLQALAIFGAQHPELPIVMLSGTVNPQIARQVLDQGAAGFLTKNGLSDEMLAALRLVLAGGIYTPPSLQTPTVGGRDRGSLSGYSHPLLTPRQEQVLYLLLDGCSTRQISQILDLAEETAKTHIAGVLRAFGVNTRLQAVLAAERYGYKRAAAAS